MGKEILIATTISNSLCDAWELQSQWRMQLTLKVSTAWQTKRWHFTHLNFNTLFSQLHIYIYVILTQVIVNTFLTFLMSIQMIV